MRIPQVTAKRFHKLAQAILFNRFAVAIWVHRLRPATPIAANNSIIELLPDVYMGSGSSGLVSLRNPTANGI
jgi:hypothetical protein